MLYGLYHLLHVHDVGTSLQYQYAIGWAVAWQMALDTDCRSSTLPDDTVQWGTHAIEKRSYGIAYQPALQGRLVRSKENTEVRPF